LRNDTKPYCYKHPRPAVTADIALFRERDTGVEVLLIQRANEPFKEFWALPGGFVDENEPLEHAAKRELKEETGITRVKIEQVKAFGDPGRDPRGHTVSILFAGLVRDNLRPRAGDDAQAAAWCDASRLPPLAFDHSKVIKAAIEHLFPDGIANITLRRS
jgi:8-oxo-dGTP diphosphatase